MIFKSCWILLKIYILSNLMVLNSFLMLFWPKKVFVTPKNVETPYDFLRVVGFGWKFVIWVVWWYWIHFWCYFDLKRFLWPPKILKPPMTVIFKSRQILLKICTLSNLMVLNSFLLLFWPKKFFDPPPARGFWPPTPPFWLKIAFWDYIFETAHQLLMNFSQMLDIIAFDDLTLVMCTKKL